jgi:hypothetical protein
MSKIFINENGKVRNLEDVELAEMIIKKKANLDSWGVIDLLINIWAKKSPDEVDALEINVDQYRESLIDKKFGQTSYGKAQERRFKLAFPKTLMLMIRTIYKSDELPMDEKFFTKFAEIYPAFKVASSN